MDFVDFARLEFDFARLDADFAPDLVLVELAFERVEPCFDFDADGPLLDFAFDFEPVDRLDLLALLVAWAIFDSFSAVRASSMTPLGLYGGLP